jgi:hypothetical protein
MVKKADGQLYVLCEADNGILVTTGDGDNNDHLMTAEEAKEVILSHHLTGTPADRLRLYRVTPVPFDIGVHIRS